MTTPSALPVALHHVSLSVADLARSIEFYEGVLGLARLPRPDMGVAGVWLALAGAQVHLIEREERHGDVGATPSATNPAGPHFAMAIADYDATVAHLEAAGISVFGTSAQRGQCWVQDPDGYVIEFIRPAV